MKVCFGDCTLDTDARRLTRWGRPVHLSPKAFDLLTVLAVENGRALSKDDLLERVWAGVFVSDASLARTVTELRTALGDDARNPKIVRTVHAFGYAFAAPIESADATPPAARTPPRGWLITPERVFPLSDGEYIVGRDPDAAIFLDSSKVSRHHARVVVGACGVTVEDLGSKNGTEVRGRRIADRETLDAGDAIRVGPFTLIYRSAHGEATTETDA